MDLKQELNLYKQQDPELAQRIFSYVENLYNSDNLKDIDKQTWFNFLDVTSQPIFLQNLNEQQRYQWAEIVFKIIQLTGFNLLNLFEQRVYQHPSKTLFQEFDNNDMPVKWSYLQVHRQIQELAALFLTTHPQPRVAIFSQNSVYSAMTDLACLFHGIFVTPLNIHFNQQILQDIFKKLKINIVVTDTPNRLELIQQVRNQLNADITIFTTFQIREKNNTFYLQKSAKRLGLDQIRQTLSQHSFPAINKVTTVMFTSGSTGSPKGVSFSHYNLISKRFARGAALPFLGQDEVMLSYLPLFHTFGRYLEMLGNIYWHGTYVFVGNNSLERLLKLFPIVQPTIFISIPLRWLNLYEKIMAKADRLSPNRDIKPVIYETIGRRFKWGLSAAGYLAPQVFKFFQQNGINLCSGFGMTEATGGITMTPPFEYVENSVGKPLPGIYTRLTQNGELQISGHYVARYLTDKKPFDTIPYPRGDESDYWLSTGDIFTIEPNGHHKIVDRVKDIYKNNKGQTIAPRVIEAKFKGVPGIKQVFVVGDARPYNVLLIVPDFSDTILQSTTNIEEYFSQIINAANRDVAPYERVVNFAILDREFSLEKGELTPKGSYNRRVIEQNFKHIIDQLYKSNQLILQNKHVKVIIPRWFVRDLGILETDLELTENGLINKVTADFLYIKPFKKNWFFIGDLIYRLESNEIDLGLLARQPKLWLGNPQVIKFCPLREGWDTHIEKFIERIRIHGDYQVIYLDDQIPTIKNAHSPLINHVNRLVIKALFSQEHTALEAVEQLGDLLKSSKKNICQVIRQRLQALAYSPYESIRVLAYRILLLDDPTPDFYKKSFPEFLLSGKTYLNEESISYLAKQNIGRQQLQALRERLYTYRTKLKWDLDHVRRKHFEYILKLLHDFTLKHWDFLPAIRSELSSWALHRESPRLAKVAQKLLKDLLDQFDQYISRKLKNHKIKLDELISFGSNISDEEKQRLIDIFKKSKFLEKSVILAFNEPDFSLDKVKNRGIWIVKIQSIREFRHYRLSINTKDAVHYDLHLVVSRYPKIHFREETALWMAAISGFPFGQRVLPALGCNMPQLGILSTEYVIGLTVWDKIKEYTNIHKAANFAIRQKHWKKLFVRAFTAFFRAWKYSGYKIVPGIVSPNNVSVPELDFKQNTMITTLTNWKKYKKPLDLVYPMIKEFYQVVIALYPWTSNMLKINWIFDAVVEALGQKSAIDFLSLLKKDLVKTDLSFNGEKLYSLVEKYIDYLQNNFHYPLSLELAVDQYKEWSLINPNATARAKSLTIQELIDLYKLNRYPLIVRYKFYYETYFANSSEQVKKQFNLLLERMARDTSVHPLQLIELSDLQAVIKEPDDIEVFTKMVFPGFDAAGQVEFEKIHFKQSDELVIKTILTDKYGVDYVFREPINPQEIGQLYQLFYKENYPKEISEDDKHLVLIDKYNRVIGGLAYKELEDNIVLLDGMVVISSLQGRRLGTAMINDFFARMGAKGIKVIKAHFLFGNYYLKHNFKVDEKWGALVRYLE